MFEQKSSFAPNMFEKGLALHPKSVNKRCKKKILEKKPCFPPTKLEQKFFLAIKMFEQKSCFTSEIFEQKSCLAPNMFKKKSCFATKVFEQNSLELCTTNI